MERLHGEKRGRPLMLGFIDSLVQKFLIATRKKGGVVNNYSCRRCFDDEKTSEHSSLRLVSIEKSLWAKSLFKRMKFTRRAATTGKIEIPEGARREVELVFLHRIVDNVEWHSIPSTLVLNLDQTPNKLVPACRMTLTEMNSKNVPIAGFSDKKNQLRSHLSLH